MGVLRVRGNWSPERLVLAIPTLGLGTVVLAFALGGGQRPIASARIYGGPTDAEGPWGGRVLVVREADGEVTPWGDAPLEIVRRGAKNEARVRGRSAADGWMDVDLAPPSERGQFELEVRSLVDGALLAQGTPTLTRERWSQAPRRGLSLAQRRRARLFLEGAVLAVPFPSRLRLTPLDCEGSENVPGGARPAERFESEWLRVSGAVVRDTVHPVGDGVSQLRLPFAGTHLLELTPSEHVVGLERGCGTGSEAARVSLTMPVVPGALHLALSGEDLSIEAPTPTETIWYTFVTDDARLSGSRLQLQVDASGISRGLLRRKAMPESEGLYLVLATSPDGRSPSTVGFPLDGQATTFDAVDGFLIDGAPAAEARESERRRRVVRALLGYVATLFALSLWLFRQVVLRADRRLIADLRRGDAPAVLLTKPRTRPTLVAGMAIALGLSLVLLWIAVFSKAS